MKGNKVPQPTESELEILQLLWAKGPCTVRQINETLQEERVVGYTTTLKLMQIMLEKQLLTRDANQRTHIYEAAVTEADTQKKLLNKFVDATFRGSAMKLVMQALGSSNASKEELDAVKKLIQDMEEKQTK